MNPPKLTPPLDRSFQPAVLAHRYLRETAERSGAAVPVRIGLEQADGSFFVHRESLLPETHPEAPLNVRHTLRILKFLLWSRGGCRVYFDGPESIGTALQQHFQLEPTGQFDAAMMGDKIYERPFEVVLTADFPEERQATQPLGKHLDGCRIGFDLGGSDRKVAAVKDGEAVFTEEVEWHPVTESDPQYHFDGIMDSLKRAAAHLPRVDAIGGSAAGVYVNNRVKVASLFRAVPETQFQTRVKDIFFELKRAWNDVPFEVVNDGEVTALAGGMSLNTGALLGLAMGTSTAGGYLNRSGNITTWLNELAFAPVDDRPNGPVDEWSSDHGCGVQFFSQQAVARLLKNTDIDIPEGMKFPEQLKRVQELMSKEDPRARQIYESIGICFGYAVAHYQTFYDFDHVLVLGRVTTGRGGKIILDRAREVLRQEFPEMGERIQFHVPDEKTRRHGQAVAAASLPKLSG